MLTVINISNLLKLIWYNCAPQYLWKINTNYFLNHFHPFWFWLFCRTGKECWSTSEYNAMQNWRWIYDKIKIKFKIEMEMFLLSDLAEKVVFTKTGFNILEK